MRLDPDFGPLHIAAALGFLPPSRVEETLRRTRASEDPTAAVREALRDLAPDQTARVLAVLRAAGLPGFDPAPATIADDGRTTTVPRTPADPAGDAAPVADAPRIERYDILRELGRGGMGVVFLARQHGLDRRVALKVLGRGGAASREEVERFHREAHAAARLHHPGIVEIFDREPGVWIARGFALAALGRASEAQRDYDGALKLDPGSLEARKWRAKTRLACGDPQGAIADLDAVLATGESADALRDRAVARLKSGDLLGGEADAARAVELSPSHPPGWRILGTARYHLGRFQGAMDALSKVLELEPANAEAWGARAAARQRLGDSGGAIADFTRALEVGGRTARTLVGRAASRSAIRDLAGAIADCDEALSLEPGHAMALALRGSARLQSGDARAAVPDLERALQLDASLRGEFENLLGSARAMLEK